MDIRACTAVMVQIIQQVNTILLNLMQFYAIRNSRVGYNLVV